jgi:hypothetical protein
MGKRGHKWEDNIKVVLQYDGIYLGVLSCCQQVTFCKHGNEPVDMVKTLGISF